jgi:hypothetical protein
MVLLFVATFLPSILCALGFWAGLEEGKRSERRLMNAPVPHRMEVIPWDGFGPKNQWGPDWQKEE